MPGPSKRWDEEEESIAGSAPGSPVIGARRNRKFDDEEEGNDDVLDSWDAAEDSEVEREKARKAAEAKAKAEAEAAAQKKSKTQRIAEHQAQRARAKAAAEAEQEEEETEAQRRERLRRTEKESDLKHAEDLFGNIGTISGRSLTATTVQVDPNDPNNTIDLATLPIFNPQGKAAFEQLRNTLAPLLAASAKKPHYTLFLQEFCKQLARELPSEQIKKVASSLTALSNEKMKEEKAAEKGGKKTKAAKTKTSLVGVSRNDKADLTAYDDAYEDFGDDDFM
ncbi:putative translation initiation factor [Thermochaetoides thermophila DSM 1495]|uniref:Eukaryotic translation initiation factor 3 subunit J n=1 Tax=Chaetomium thermophilum (strain DSM 1495 / CBS 144.50 / IMI 039719) TaxID=759272 RepID=G0S3T4_CHATD|nr:putative translation initiation factor [Thermochaetoides thermophila DSM 1495]EGS21210.1 putative translation initiation factor [Thermochaetoides thermophila DSM 1495]